jgi:hypothetical protein
MVPTLIVTRKVNVSGDRRRDEKLRAAMGWLRQRKRFFGMRMRPDRVRAGELLL